MIIGYSLLDPILRLFGATETLLGFSREYLSVVLIGAVFITFAMSSNNLVRAEGRATVAMVTMLIGAGMNIILDPIFIFGFNMGIRGAATATVISQGLSFLFLMFYFLTGRSSLEIRLRHLKPNGNILKEILSLGVPAFIRQSGASILGIIINNTLGRYGGDLYISAYGVITRLMMFGLMPLFGIVQGFQPIAGYNYGAKRFDRLRSTIKVSVLATTGMAMVFFLLVMVFPRTLVSIFTRDASLIEAASTAGRIIFMVIPLIGVQIIGAGFFQAIGKALPALLLGLSRQILILIPLLLLLPLAFGLSGVWLSFPVADFTATIITVLLWTRELRRLRRIEPSQAAPVLQD
jgi:putative MATE family efflux protein